MTDVPLREYLETRFSDRALFFQAEVRSIREAIEKAEHQLNIRLDSMNAFRDALREQASRLASREEVAIRFDLFDTRLKALELHGAETRGRAAITSAMVATAVSFAAALASFFIK